MTRNHRDLPGLTHSLPTRRSPDLEYDLAVAGYNQTLVAALHGVTDAVQAARSLDAQIASATQARDAAQSALEIADTRYSAGLGTQLDVLSAQRPLDRKSTRLNSSH